ncbi:hydantoin racemase [Verticiella sediminum]|uniref:Hydantoin racemase n=1 Tax=Verticiella sediminum TaxID=1247510 RepID=A0A556B1Z0_9BURK|nr:aspartate/glutamate racemase family protein [Verticiella sediminum]TSH99173.1 hydantoin racemase [Verticiella sediminum]
MKILLVNPNRTQAVTDAVLAAGWTAARPGTSLVAVTGRSGPLVIGSRAENAIAQREVLELAAAHGADADAIVLGVSLDTALWACRELFTVPVIGMTEAGLLMAATVGTRIGVLTLGRAMVPLYEELAAAYGMAARVAAVDAVDIMPAQALAQPHAVREALCAAIARMRERRGVDVVLLAGAALASMAADAQAASPVPVLDGVACAVALAQARVDLRLPPSTLGADAPLSGRDVTGVSPALAARFKDSSRSSS